MKKLLICLLACVLILAMAGCAADQTGGNGTTATHPNTNASTPSDPSTEPTVPSQPAPSQSDPSGELSLGVITGTKYENTFIGIGFDLPEGWSFYTDEQIKELNNIAGELAGQDYLDALKNATVIYDMMAASATQTDNIIVNLEKATSAQLNSLNLASNFEASFSLIKSSLENMGYQNVTHEVVTLTIDGQDFTAMNISATISGVTMYQTSIAIKCSGYLASLSVTTFDAAGTASLLENLYLIK